MAYWACAQLDGRREQLALHCLSMAGYQTYLPRIQSSRRGSVALFPGYTFILIELQWHAARWSPGIRGILMSGIEPAHVPDAVLDGLRARERNGLVILPRPPSSAPQFRSGDRVKLTSGPLIGLSGLVEGMRAHERVAVLLQLLGSRRSVEMAAADVALIGE